MAASRAAPRASAEAENCAQPTVTRARIRITFGLDPADYKKLEESDDLSELQDSSQASERNRVAPNLHVRNVAARNQTTPAGP